MNQKIIPCIHDGKKRRFDTVYYGRELIFKLCPDCENKIKTLKLAEIEARN